MDTNEMGSKIPVLFGMLLFLVGLMIFLPAFPLQANERQAQCEAWAVEEGLKGEEAKEYIEYCMTEERAPLVPEEAPATN